MPFVDSQNSTGIPEQPIAPLYIVVVATMFYIIIFFVGVLGNVLAIFVISCGRSMRTSVNMFILNLCIADLLVMLICMPTALTEIYSMEAWYFGSFMCKLVPFIENTIANASVLTILVISIERYRVVCQPLKGIQEDFSKEGKILLAIWIISAASSIPWFTIAIYRPSNLMDGTPIMVCRNPIYLSWQRVFVVLVAVLFFAAPCTILFALYFYLCRTLMSTSSENEDIHYPPRSNTERKRLQNQVINIIASIVILFFACHLPLRVASLWFTFEDKFAIASLGLEKYLNILFSTRIIFYLNHALNPIVYNFVSTKFRSALRTLCSRNSRSGSFVSTYRKQKQSYVFTNKTKSTKQKVDKTEKLDRKSSHSRQKRNEFYGIPMHDNMKYEKAPSTSSKDYEVKIELKDKTLAVTFSLKNGKQLNTLLHRMNEA